MKLCTPKFQRREVCGSKSPNPVIALVIGGPPSIPVGPRIAQQQVVLHADVKYSLYRLTTPERVFFFEATHRITRLPGDAIELDISVYPFDKVGNFVYPRRQSSEFSTAEIAHIRDLIADYLKTDRQALHPIYAPKERVRSVRVRLP